MNEPYPLIIAALQYINDNKNVCRVLLRRGRETGASFTEQIATVLEKTVTEWIRPLKQSCDNGLLNIYCHFVANGFAAVATSWLEEEIPRPLDEMADILGNIMDYGLEALK